MSLENYYNEQHDKELTAKFKELLTPFLGTEYFHFKNGKYLNLYDPKIQEGHWKLVLNKNLQLVAEFTLLQMPGCCGICVSTKAIVYPNFQGKGLGTCLNSIRIEMARYMGYTVLLCTDIESNKAQRAILAKNGWKDIYQFVNKRTKNTVNISVINL